MTYNNAVVQRLRICVFLFVAALAVSTPAVFGETYSPPSNPREDINLDAGWRFIRQDVAGAQTNGFDDSTWTLLNLPHTWNNLDGQDGGNDYYRGIGWYRRHYMVSTNEAGRRLFLKFDGANIVSDVYVNGNFVGEHQGGFAAFVFDVTPYVNVGGDNVIAVKVNNASNSNIPPLSADFTFFGGIYRDAHLLATDPVHISPLDYGSPGVYLKTTSVSSNSANLQVTTVVSNASASPATVTVRAIVTDAATNIVTTLTNIVTLSASSVSNVVASAIVSNPHLWDGLNDPYLYGTFVEVYNGSNLTDLVSQPLGFRYFSVDSTNGFFLNGRHYDLHGVNMHQDWLNSGWALSSAQRQTNFMLLKEIGATALRLSHYQHHDENYQLGDQNGIILWSEVPNINEITSAAAYYTNTLQQLKEMIRQHYNNPSVVCWGLFNEITLSSGPDPNPLIGLEAQLAAQEDPTRPTTAAANSSDNAPTTTNSQLICFNKYFGWYNGVLSDFAPWADNFHATYPTRKVGVSEYGCGANVYQHSEDPVTEPANGGQYHPEEYQNLFHESYWQAMKVRPFLWGKYVWNMFDFASDGRNEGNTPGLNDKGLVTYDRQIRKDAFYFYKANWTTNAMIYITGHTFSNRTTNITAKAYSNCDSAELLLNSISQGTRTSTSNIFTWAISLAGGTNYVQAIGTKGGTNVTDSLVWIVVPTPPTPPSPLSQGKPVTASSFQAGNEPSHGNDGNSSTRWAASDGTYPQWWRVDLGSVQPITNAVISWYNSSSRAYKYKIENSNDDTNYTVLVANTNNTTFGDTTNALSATTRYVRITVTGTTAAGGFASFYECQIYGGAAPAAPTGLTATAVSTNQIALSWSASSGATSYNAKRATNSGGPYTIVANPSTTNYTDTGLANTTTYYYVISALNGGGESTNSTEASATTLSAFQSWQMSYFGCLACPQADPAADPDGDGQNNQAEWLAGTDPTNSASAFQIISIVPLGNDIVVTWRGGIGSTGVVQAVSGDYSTNFSDISSANVVPGSGTTSYADVGAATNAAVRFYRVRLQ
jgi:beta-galactosidase